MILYSTIEIQAQNPTSKNTHTFENPGFRPKSELSVKFIDNYEQSTFVVFPTIIRKTNSTTWSDESAKKLSELLETYLKLNVKFNKSVLDPGKIEGKAQFEFFENDMEILSEVIMDDSIDSDYNIILEVLFQPQQSMGLRVFGIHLFILDDKGKNAFSFLLNSHHDYFTNNHLYTQGFTTEDLDWLLGECTRVACDALNGQMVIAGNGIEKIIIPSNSKGLSMQKEAIQSYKGTVYGIKKACETIYPYTPSWSGTFTERWFELRDRAIFVHIVGDNLTDNISQKIYKYTITELDDKTNENGIIFWKDTSKPKPALCISAKNIYILEKEIKKNTELQNHLYDMVHKQN